MRHNKLVITLIITLAIGVMGVGYFVNAMFADNVKVPEGGVVLFIDSNSSYQDVLDSLYSNLEIKNPAFFEWMSKKKNYPNVVKSGRYVIDGEKSYMELIDLLRSGNQTPVNVTFNNIRTLNELAGKIGGQIEADSTDIINFLSNPTNYAEDGFNRETVISIFIPNTYEMFWNTDASGLYDRMYSEYKRFWTKSRLEKAGKYNLTPVEVSTLASIIDDEVVKVDDKPIIAGVYLNRMRIGMPLQACPTIRFALNDYTITRVLNKHLTVESPYNTYKYKGLPPGPIRCPSVEGIDAVLNAKKHDYLYFAAKSDFSGYHHFSRTLREHNRYAEQYQRELNKRRIFK